jgi:dihydrofolate reductase
MSKLRVHNFSISLDGYGAGPRQSTDNPLGVGGEKLHDWFLPTRTFQNTYGKESGTTGPDDEFAARMWQNIGAWIMGRNMFGPIRGAWPDESWRGWWGENPPYHVDVFVLTHYARDPVKMAGGTTFYFVTDGIHDAFARAKAAAKGKDMLLGGGVSAIRQYLQAGLVDEAHFAVSPVLLGAGEHLMQGLDLPALGYKPIRYVGTQRAAHYVLTKEA